MKNMDEVMETTAPAPLEAPPPDGASELEVLVAERDRAVAQKDDLWDRLVRKQAEFENLRKRASKEKDEIQQFAAMEVIRSLLPVLDDFQRALGAPGEGEEYRKGIDLIFRRFWDLLVQNGLSPIESKGKKFDPHFHQAVDTVKTPDQEDHTNVEEYQRGYEFKGRLLRPAMVRVAVRD